MARRLFAACARVSRVSVQLQPHFVGIPRLFSDFRASDELVLDLRLTTSDGKVTIHSMWPSSVNWSSGTPPKSERHDNYRLWTLKRWQRQHIFDTVPMPSELKYWGNGDQSHCIDQCVRHNIDKKKFLVLDYFRRTLKLAKPFVDPESELNLIKILKRCGFKHNDVVKAKVFMEKVKEVHGYIIIPCYPMKKEASDLKTAQPALVATIEALTPGDVDEEATKVIDPEDVHDKKKEASDLKTAQPALVATIEALTPGDVDEEATKVIDPKDVHDVREFGLLFGEDNQQRDHVPKKHVPESYIRIKLF